MYVAMARALIDAPSRAKQLAGLRVPTLVMVGEQDTPLLDACERLAGIIPGARFVRVPDAGHSPQVENPDVWFATVTEFLDGVVD
jgi:pimeloyl-ACP methyl ester carboxylesterase